MRFGRLRAAIRLVLLAMLIALWVIKRAGWGVRVAFLSLGAMAMGLGAVVVVVAAALGVHVGQRRTEGGHA